MSLEFHKIVLLKNVDLVPKQNYLNLAQISKVSSKLILKTFKQLRREVVPLWTIGTTVSPKFSENLDKCW